MVLSVIENCFPPSTLEGLFQRGPAMVYFIFLFFKNSVFKPSEMRRNSLLKYCLMLNKNVIGF